MSDTAKHEATGLEQHDGQQQHLTHEQASPGAQLAARRQELGWSVEQVASQLNLASRQIQAIEADNYGALPGMATARGFVRAYAKLLNVDAVPLLAIIAKEVNSVEEALPLRRELPSIRFAQARPAFPGRKRSWSRPLIVVLIVVLLVGAGFLLSQRQNLNLQLPVSFNFGWSQEQVAIVPENATKEAEVQGQALSSVAPADTVQGSAAMSTSDAVEVVKLLPDTANNSVNNSGSAATQASALPSNAVAANENAKGDSKTADAKDLLMLKLREDSWVQIKRPDNSTIVATVLKAGTTESFKIVGPVVLTVGNAGGVEAILRGTPLDLKADPRTNVARLNLK